MIIFFLLFAWDQDSSPQIISSVVTDLSMKYITHDGCLNAYTGGNEPRIALEKNVLITQFCKIKFY
jgi:hypothetical protein